MILCFFIASISRLTNYGMIPLIFLIISFNLIVALIVFCSCSFLEGNFS